MSLMQAMARSRANRASGDGSDPHWSNVAVLAHFDTSGPAIINNEYAGFNISLASPSIVATPAQFGDGSMLVNGAQMLHNTAQVGGATPFTIETFFMRRSGSGPVNTQFIFGIDTNNGVFIPSANQGIGVFVQGHNYVILSSSYPSGNVWHYLVLQWDGTLLKLALDGVVVGSSPYSWTSRAYLKLGYSGSRNEAYPDYLDEFRYTDGVARYSDSFPVPTKAFPNG